jgi:hypothetical protein
MKASFYVGRISKADDHDGNSRNLPNDHVTQLFKRENVRLIIIFNFKSAIDYRAIDARGAARTLFDATD